MRKFEKLVKEIGQSFSVNVAKLIQPRELKVFRLGTYIMPVSKESVDLSEYFIDEEGDMYTLNDDTSFTKFGSRLVQVSNNAYDAGGKRTNSFRATNGRKVTIRREHLIRIMRRGDLGLKLTFDELPVVQGKVDTQNFTSNIA